MSDYSKRIFRVGIAGILTAAILSVSIPDIPAVRAAGNQVITKSIPYNLSGNDKMTGGGILYTRFDSMEVNFNEDAGANNKILKIEFIKGNEVIDTVEVNDRYYRGKITFSGEADLVQSLANIPIAGGYFAWQRGASQVGWTPGGSTSGYKFIGKANPKINPSTGLHEYPGVELELDATFSRKESFKSEKYGISVSSNVVDNRRSIIDSLNDGTAVRVNNLKDVRYPKPYTPGEFYYGKNDASTVMKQVVYPDLNGDKNYVDLNQAKVIFTQRHYNADNFHKLPAGNAAMLFYLANYEYDIVSYTYRYPEKMKIYYEGDSPDDIESSSECTEPVPGQVLKDEVMIPYADGVIKADRRGNEPFDVIMGIPTSESLYGNVFTEEYLFRNQFVEMIGMCTYNVTVKKTFHLTWYPAAEEGATEPPEPMTDEEEIVRQYTIERPYSYWVINNLEVYEIKEAALWNYAFEGNGIRIEPSYYTPPDFSTEITGKFKAPPLPDTIIAPPESRSGGQEPPDLSGEDLLSEAEAAIPNVIVQNDTFYFNGAIIMDGIETEEAGPPPGSIPEPRTIGENVLYSPGHIIPISKTNKPYQQSTGTIYYGIMTGNINGGADINFPIYGINPITVHTPVVNYSSVSDDQAHNQKTNPNENRSALILERPFKIRMPTWGQHLDEWSYPGYGDRDYAKYYRIKQVLFPFDVYNENKTQFIPKRTWIDIPVNQVETTFFLPVWVDEGHYQVYFRNIAENAPGTRYEDIPYEQDANLNLINHVAVDEVSVDVIGRLYDFHITDIADFNWEKVFRVSKGSSNPTGVSYWVGTRDIDGQLRGNSMPFTLLIRPGSHPLQGYKNVSIKTGYHFKFDLKTKGNMFGERDGVVITPTFYFVSQDGKVREEVDLYYRTNEKPFVKIGSRDDQAYRYVILNERLRNVPVEALTDTALYKYDHYNGLGQNLSRNQYVDLYLNKTTKQKTPVGSYSRMALPEQLRTFIGPKTKYLNHDLPSSVDAQRANASIQQWYGEYSLPANPYIVKAGQSIEEAHRVNGRLDDKSPVFLQNRYKNGYIVVNFNIESVRDGNVNTPHLQYIHAPMMNKWGENQWQMEGFQETIKDAYGHEFSLTHGDVVFYHANKSSRDDFSSQVPH